MSNLKELFNRDKELAQKWGAVSHADYFEKALLFATGIMGEGDVTTEQLAGAKKLKEILLTMADTEADFSNEPMSGLKHDVLGAAQEMRKAESAKK